MKHYRPRHPRTDENHNIVPEFIERIGRTYGGLTLDYRDVSRLGGSMTDYIVCEGPLAIFLEVKTEEAIATKNMGMTDGEIDFFDNWPGPKALVATHDDIAEVLRNHLDAAYALQDALHECLPGATFDRVLAAMLQYKASCNGLIRRCRDGKRWHHYH